MGRVVDLAIVRRVIGFAIVAAGVLTTFLPVGAHTYLDGPYHGECGSVWHAMFANWNNYLDYECGSAAVPHLWIAGGVVGVGMGIAFWAASWGRFLGMVALVSVLTGLINAAGLMASGQMGCDNGDTCADWRPD